MDEFRSILRGANHEQRHALSELIGSTFGGGLGSLSDHIVYLRHGAVGQLFHKNYPWEQIVTDVADHIGVDWHATDTDGRTWCFLSTEDLENAVCAKVFSDIFSKLPPEEQSYLLDGLDRDRDHLDLKAVLATGGTMALARAGGFGTYLLASTTLGMLTNALGFTLPFAVYMGMSSTISILLGPIGWTALGIGAFWAFNQPNWQRLLLAVVFVSMLRQQQKQ